MSARAGIGLVGISLSALLCLVVWLGSDDGSSAASGTAKAPLGTRECARPASSLAAAQDAVTAAAPGSVVCLADGSYGKLVLRAAKPEPGVVLRAASPGGARLDGVEMYGSHLTVAGFHITSDAEVEPGSIGMTIAHNRISGGYFGVDAGPTDTVTVNDVAIVGNKFVGPFGEDAIRLNRYHDANGDGVGALVANNEFTNIRENGNHSDCLQTVWVGDHLVYRGNYLHDNRCQGFFVKDQAQAVEGIVVEDNLFLRNEAPCAPGGEGCGPTSDLQIFGPYTGLVMRRNTIWGNGDDAVFQEADGARPRIEANVVYKFWTSTDLSAARFRDNTRCLRESSGGLWPVRVVGEVISCTPHFLAPRRDDYRVRGDRGVTWAPADRHFGP